MNELHDKDFESIEEHEHHHHVVPPRTYLTILLALLVFTGLTVWVSFIDLGPFNPVLALAIAATNLFLVVQIFMKVKYSTKLTKLTVAAGLFTYLIQVGMTLSDYWTRDRGRR